MSRLATNGTAPALRGGAFIACVALMVAWMGCKSQPKEAQNPNLEVMQMPAEGEPTMPMAGATAQAGTAAPTAQAGGQANAGSGGSGGSGATNTAGTSALPTEDAGTPAALACDTEGETRCVAQGSVARQRCENGQLVAADCADGEVCDNGSGNEAMCVALSEQCVGHSDEAICVGADMHFCSADSTDLRVEHCESDRQCQAGLAAGQCAVCLPGSFECDGAQLKRCQDDGMSLMDDTECPSADLCNEISGACTDATCLPGDKTCDSDTLSVCNASQTGFDDDEDCGPGLCDRVGKECDVCVPGTRNCNNASDGYLVCNADGQGRAEAACDADEPYCVGDGTCVECISPNDCETGNPCVTPLCNAGSCGSANALAGSCSLQGGGNGVCDGLGGCVECVTLFDCGGDRPYCVFNQCRPCFGACGLGAQCDRDDDCGSGSCEAGSCRPACSGACEIGDACVADDDCASDDCTDGFCTKICEGDVSIADQSDYDAARECVEIHGSLAISYAVPVLDLELPVLTTVTGDIAPIYQGLTNHPMTHLRLPALRSVGGNVTLSASNLVEVRWPQLLSIGGGFNIIAMPQLTAIDLPSLQSVHDYVQILQSANLTDVDMPALRTAGTFSLGYSAKVDHAAFDSIQSVSGGVDLNLMWFLSYDDVRALWEVSDRSLQPLYIGCCLSASQQAGCDGFDPNGMCSP